VFRAREALKTYLCSERSEMGEMANTLAAKRKKTQQILFEKKKRVKSKRRRKQREKHKKKIKLLVHFFMSLYWMSMQEKPNDKLHCKHL